MAGLALFTEPPRYCPGCGKPINLGRTRYELNDWLVHCSHSCNCGFNYQLAEEEYILTAADAAGGDLRQQRDLAQR